MKPIGIIAAMEAELTFLLNMMQDRTDNSVGRWRFHTGALYGRLVVLAESSPGKVFASLTAQRLIDNYDPCALIMTGVAGALRGFLRVGDVVIGTKYLQHDVDARALGLPRGVLPETSVQEVPADARLVALALSAATKRTTVYEGTILSGDQFFTEEETLSRAYLFDAMGGTAIDMESAAVAVACLTNDVPFVALRVICSELSGSQEQQFISTFASVAENTSEIIEQILRKYGDS